MTANEGFSLQGSDRPWDRLAQYDARSGSPKTQATETFLTVAQAAMSELEEKKDENTHQKVEIAKWESLNTSLSDQLRARRQLQLVAGILSVIATVFVGIGINYLTSAAGAGGWVFLVSGGLLHLVSLSLLFVGSA